MKLPIARRSPSWAVGSSTSAGRWFWRCGCSES